ENCGRCGHKCGTNEYFSRGSCTDCTSDQAVCDNRGVDLRTDGENCGACGIPCAANQICCGAQCVGLSLDTCSRWQKCRPLGDSCGADGKCRCGTLDSCPVGKVCCAGACVNPKTDRDHCGSCNPCSAGQKCCAGSCFDVLVDSKNCGDCQIDCAFT